MLNWNSKIQFEWTFKVRVQDTNQHLKLDPYAAMIYSFVKETESDDCIFETHPQEIKSIIEISLKNITNLKTMNCPCCLKFHKTGIVKLNDYSESGDFAKKMIKAGLYDKLIDYFSKESTRNQINLFIFSELLIEFIKNYKFNIGELIKFKLLIQIALDETNDKVAPYFKLKKDKFSLSFVECFIKVLNRILKSIEANSNYKTYLFYNEVSIYSKNNENIEIETVETLETHQMDQNVSFNIEYINKD
jgi:hypothetical protein